MVSTLLWENQIQFPMEITNTGKTPARALNADFIMQVLNLADEPTFDYSSPLTTRFEAHAYFPSPTPHILAIGPVREFPRTKTVEPIILTQDLLDRYNSGDLWISGTRKNLV